MQRNRSSSKRAYSPSMGSEGPAPKMPQLDGSCLGKPSVAEAGHDCEPEDAPRAAATGTTAPEATKPPKPSMPDFLRLSDEVVHQKFSEIVKLENDRIQASKQDPDGKWARMASDSTLDRYSNIHPWSNNRVKLHVPEGVNDYINASPVTLTSTSEVQSTLKSGIQDKYICMQGPKRETVDHVWHMVWHDLAIPYDSSPAVVIMLSPTHAPMPDDPTKLFEKCYQYYPIDENSPPLLINETNILGDEFKASVKFVSREPDIPGTSIELRQLLMTVEGEDEEKPIWHYLYPNWPDFGALEEENVASILTLMDLTRKQNGKGENPRLVHCSAGVGRTGTFIALEFLIGELEGGAWEGWNEGPNAGHDPIYETVNQLREQRKTMVQAFEQYAFLYEVLKKVWEEKYHTPCVGGEHNHVDPPELVAGVDGTATGLEEKKGKNICGYPSEEEQAM